MTQIDVAVVPFNSNAFLKRETAYKVKLTNYNDRIKQLAKISHRAADSFFFYKNLNAKKLTFFSMFRRQTKLKQK